MDLIANAVFRILPETKPSIGYRAGLYRVILDEPSIDRTAAVLFHPEDDKRPAVGGRRKMDSKDLKRSRKKPPQALVGTILWMRRSELQTLHDTGLLKPMTVERQVMPLPIGRSETLYEQRVQVMDRFLDLKILQESLVVHGGISGLVNETILRTGASRPLVHKLWSLLCRWGIDPRSLAVRFDRCGAANVKRPCDPPSDHRPGRKKAGRKTLQERIVRAYGLPFDATQPGMSSEWAAAIQAADNRIKAPKPSWPTRYDQILLSAYCCKAQEVDGKLEFVKPAQGTYPNLAQVKRVLTFHKTRLERLIERTTKQHYRMAHRGLVGRSWCDAAGPGHTWAIDSTVGDIYLRSSLNRAWVVGRPIVYIIVDIWSTAIVGFYVCLSGPSWETAKISLFNAIADPTLVANLWGYEPTLTLNPTPTVCYRLLCDRGEYLSEKHRCTAKRLLNVTSYTPPYRGDLKGLVEVLHCIAKNAQFLFIPGAMDFRRAELELRKVNPADCVLTVREYVHVLDVLFTNYNLTADRSDRVDAHMLAAGVYPSPAGLWRWGHAIGIGYRRSIPEADLIDELLPSATARVRRDTVRHAQCDYTSPEIQQAEWTAYARNFGGWDVPVRYYPGAMGPIWTPNVGGAGLLRLQISDQSRASPEVTLDEWYDVLALETMQRAGVNHTRTCDSLDALARMKALRDLAARKTADALSRASGSAPTMSEARVMEVAATSHPSRSEAQVTEHEREQREAMEMHVELMHTLLHSDDDGGAGNAG